MNFTREPIIETIITPKDGCKLVLRNSKGIGQEEYFVDAVEVVSFGRAFFYRSLERPKCFLVPVTDYEIVEVRETRMVLKNAPVERGIKIGGGRESTTKVSKETLTEKAAESEAVEASAHEEMAAGVTEITRPEVRGEKKRERRRNRRRRGGREETKEAQATWTGDEEQTAQMEAPEDIGAGIVSAAVEEKGTNGEKTAPVFTSLLPPPPTLISETLSRYRGNPEYQKAFYSESVQSDGGAITTEEDFTEEELPTTREFFEDIPPPVFPEVIEGESTGETYTLFSEEDGETPQGE